MADVIQLTDGTTIVELALDTDNLQLLVPGTEMGIPEHDNLYHQSPWAHGEKLARFRLSNRKWPLKILVGDKDSATAADDLANALNTLGRLIAQARRYHLSEDVEKVYLKLCLDGASQNTYFDAVDLEPSGASILDETSRIRRDAQVSFVLITEPLGYGDEETLCNELGTPHFEEDGNADGLADQWNKSGTPTTTLDTGIFLCGSQSQKVVTDNSGTDGIYSDTVACTAYRGQNFVSYAWVYRSAGDQITLTITGDVSGSLGTHTYSAATVTDIDSGGRTWKRLTVTGTVGASDSTITMRIERLTGDAAQATTYYVDKCYLQFGVSTVPVAWMSCRYTYSEYDSTSGGVIPYIDVEDITGGAEALMKLELRPTAIKETFMRHVILARCSRDQVASQSYWITRNTNVSVTPANTYVDIASVNLTLADYGKYITLVSASDATNPVAVFQTVCWGTGTTTGQSVVTDERRLTLSSINQVIQMGALGITEIPYSAFTDVRELVYQVKYPSTTGTIYVGVAIYLPIDDEGYYMCNVEGYGVSWWSAGARYYQVFDGIKGRTYLIQFQYNYWWGDVVEELGTVPTLIPKRFNRLFILGTDPQNLLIDYGSNPLKTTMTYRPQTEFLL